MEKFDQFREENKLNPEKLKMLILKQIIIIDIILELKSL